MKIDSFNIWAPNNRSFTENTAFTLYAMDQERNELISNVINTLIANPERYYEPDFQSEVFFDCGLYHITDVEYEFIMNNVSEYLE